MHTRSGRRSGWLGIAAETRPPADVLPCDSRRSAPCTGRSSNPIDFPAAIARRLRADAFCGKLAADGGGRDNQKRFVTVSLNYGWQHDRELWDRIPADLRDSRSWRAVGFVENEAASVPSGQPGIYFFCTSPVGRRPPVQIRGNDLFSNLFTPIYIGKTDNLRRRFLEHCRSQSGKLNSARLCFGASMQFWFHRLSQDRIKDDEAVLIRCFGPTANERMETIRVGIRGPFPIGIHDRKQERHGRKA